jgi:hypothetical protein
MQLSPMEVVTPGKQDGNYQPGRWALVEVHSSVNGLALNHNATGCWSHSTGESSSGNLDEGSIENRSYRRRGDFSYASWLQIAPPSRVLLLQDKSLDKREKAAPRCSFLVSADASTYTIRFIRIGKKRRREQWTYTGVSARRTLLFRDPDCRIVSKLLSRIFFLGVRLRGGAVRSTGTEYVLEPHQLGGYR